MLLDTHTLIWSYFDPSRLSATAVTLITHPNNWVFVSAATLWEVAIKISLRKLNLAESYVDFVRHAIVDNGFTIVPIEPAHTAALIALPHHHRDPFDRLIIAQAIAEHLPVISVDPVFDLYPIQRMW